MKMQGKGLDIGSERRKRGNDFDSVISHGAKRHEKSCAIQLKISRSARNDMLIYRNQNDLWLNTAAYHLGQTGLIAGVISQFG